MRKLVLNLLGATALAIFAGSAAQAQDASTLVWAVGAPVGNLDIASSLEGTNRRLLKGSVLEGLTKIVKGPEGLSWEPLLATSWEHIEPDRWRFKLREDVLFQDGTPLTAEDVAFTVNKIADPASAKSSILQNLASANVVDKYTVDIVTKSPDFFAYRAAAEIPVQKKGWGVENPEEASNSVIGTGAYRLTGFSPARDGATLERWDGWWDHDIQPEFDKVQLRVIPDAGARLAALRAGEVQIAFDLTPDLLAAAPKTITTPASEILLLRLNALKGVLADVKVRQALNYAVDRKVIIENIWLNFAGPSNGQAVPANVHGFNPDLKDYPYDPDKARALIEEAGAKGAELSLMCSGEQYGSRGLDTCATLAAMYEAVGLKINIQQVTYASWIADGLMAPKNGQTPPDMFYLQTGSETLDATPIIRNYLACNNERSTICDPELDAMAKGALSLDNPELRRPPTSRFLPRPTSCRRWFGCSTHRSPWPRRRISTASSIPRPPRCSGTSGIRPNNRPGLSP
ncbi:MAG TPA: ABC transporter substrate-binding protein [Devosia sp.]|nr:ABC transporter substrate-binding protein [Devosia sp.]